MTMRIGFIRSPQVASPQKLSPTQASDTRNTSSAYGRLRSDHQVRRRITSAPGPPNQKKLSMLASSTETLSMTGPARWSSASGSAVTRASVWRIQATAARRWVSPMRVKGMTRQVDWPSGPMSTPRSRFVASSRGSDSGGSVSRARATPPLAIGSNHGSPSASTGAAGPLAAARKASTAGASSVQPSHDAITTSPLWNSSVNFS